MKALNDKQRDTFFYLFLLAHICVWTITPLFVRQHLPMDSLEAVNWGQTFLWGYDRNPYFNAWLAGALVKLSKGSDWIIYLASSSCVAVSLWAVYRLAKRWFTPIAALVSVIMLEGLQYYHIGAIELNDNVLELALWPLMASFLYTAVKDKQHWHWLLVGLFTGLALMSKYLTLLMIVPMYVWLFADRNHYFVFKSPWFYLNLGMLALLVTPHVMWLMDHNFMTFRYAQDRMGDFAWYYHLINPGLFSLKLLLSFIGPLFLLLLASRIKRTGLNTVNPDDRLFIHMMAFGPLVSLLLISLGTGSRITTMWGQPFLAWMGVWVVMQLQPYIEITRLKRFATVTATCMLILVMGYSFSLRTAGSDSSANFDGVRFAEQVEAIWGAHSDAPLTYVAGDRFYVGSVAHYGETGAKAFYDFDGDKNPWIDVDDVHNKGAVIVWRANKTSKISKQLKALRPNLVCQTQIDNGELFNVAVYRGNS